MIPVWLVWFTDENSKALEMKDNINLNLFINSCVTYNMRYSTVPRNQMFVKGYGFLSLAKIWAKMLVKMCVKI